MSDPTHPEEPAAAAPLQEPPLADPALAETHPHDPPQGLGVPPAPPNRGSGVLPVIYVVGLLVLIGGLVWLWRNPTREPARPDQTASLTALRDQEQALGQQVQALGEQVQALQNRVAAVEQRPAAATPAALGPLEARVAALEHRVPPAPQPPQPDAATQAAVAALSAKVDRLAEAQSGSADLAARVDQLARAQSTSADLAARVDALGKTQQSAAADLGHRLDTVAAQSAATQHAAAQLPGLVDRARRTAQLQAAQAALDAGQKLGPIEGAPPALARFAETAPPTGAGLQLAFPAAAQAAERASRPDLAGKPFLTRVWLRVQEAVTIRQDDHVIVGDPASGILAHARRTLDAGDLAGAVGALAALPPSAAQAPAMADWLGRARALLDARAALAGMTTSG